MYERFTDRARKVLALANQEAQRLRHESIDTEHILLGIVEEGTGVGAHVLHSLGVNLEQLQAEVKRLVKSGADSTVLGKLPQTDDARKVLHHAIEEARAIEHRYVGTEHLLLGLLHEPGTIAAQVLTNLGLSLEKARDEAHKILHDPLSFSDDHPEPTAGWLFIGAERIGRAQAVADKMGKRIEDLAGQAIDDFLKRHEAD